MSENVFNEKADYLIGAREEVIKRDNMASELDDLRAQQKKITKRIAMEEKSIADEIASTIRKRKQQITDTYDDRLDDNRARKKRVAHKRTKKKNQRMAERIEEETKDIRENTRELDVEMKTLLKKNNVPGFCSSKMYFIMFYPRGTTELVAMFISFLTFFAGIPSLITFIIKKIALEDKKDINVAFWCMLVFAISVIIQLIIYFVTFNATKIKHNDVINQARSIEDKINANKRQADAIKNSISKDKDESIYKLDVYDEKLANLDQELENISNEKQGALKVFEEETKQLIIEEINGRRLQALENMKAEKGDIDYKITEGEKQYSEKVLYITNQYASYLGDELCKQDKLTDLITLMEEGQADTVSEAISIYKGQKSSK